MKYKIAFQGERGAYSEAAALHYFGKNISVLPCPDFETVFKKSLQPGFFGMIPLENSLTGSIHENYDLLLKYDVIVSGEIKLRISHTLIALPGTKLRDIRTVYSHPQALGQCKDYLKKLPSVLTVPVYDTAGAVKIIKEDKIENSAAIASQQAAIDYKMEVLAKNLESNKANYTRFIVIGRKPSVKARCWKTSIVFSFKNVPGALFKCLGVFAMRDIDLLKIESRPIHGKPWAYLFYLDFKGTIKGDTEKNALHHLKEITLFIKVLGSYQAGEVVVPRYK
jgi:prephenate dehydratase